MKCTAVRDLLFRKIDNELDDLANAELDEHLAGCASCSRDYALVSFPSRVAQAIPPPEPSPFFYGKLKMSIEGEAQKAAGWQIIFGLARQVVPALAGVTLALLSVFAYFQMRGNEPDLYKAYDRVFISEEQPNRMLIYEQGEITDESVLNAIAERQVNHRQTRELK
jgi:hypothetical protein